jgi:hypothetical protein
MLAGPVLGGAAKDQDNNPTTIPMTAMILPATGNRLVQALKYSGMISAVVESIQRIGEPVSIGIL